MLDNCTGKYAVGGLFSAQTAKDGLEAKGAGLFASYDCTMSSNSKDGFNYHFEGAVIPNVLQVRCKGYKNGQIVLTSQSNNGSTVHDGIKLIDIGGEFLGSVGTNFGHIDNDTQVWAVGTLAGNSDGDEINGGGIDYGAFGVWVGTATMWLDSCTDKGSNIGVFAGGGSTAYIRNHSGTGSYVGDVFGY